MTTEFIVEGVKIEVSDPVEAMWKRVSERSKASIKQLEEALMVERAALKCWENELAKFPSVKVDDTQ